MSIKFTLAILLFLPFAAIQAQEKSIPTESKIDRVIVFLQGAQIERSGQSAIPSGTSTIVFQGLSPEIEEQSIQVSANLIVYLLFIYSQEQSLTHQPVS